MILAATTRKDLTKHLHNNHQTTPPSVHRFGLQQLQCTGPVCQRRLNKRSDSTGAVLQAGLVSEDLRWYRWDLSGKDQRQRDLLGSLGYKDILPKSTM